MRLIDAENLVSICKIMADKTDSPQIWEQLISMIESVPTIGAEPVTMRTGHLEFVDRNELKRWVEGWQKKTRRLCPLRTAKSIPIRTLYEFLEALPIAKADLLREQGRWVHGDEVRRIMRGDEVVLIEYTEWHCSNCGITYHDDYFRGMAMLGKKYPSYCPNCGAAMEAEE